MNGEKRITTRTVLVWLANEVRLEKENLRYSNKWWKAHDNENGAGVNIQRESQKLRNESRKLRDESRKLRDKLHCHTVWVHSVMSKEVATLSLDIAQRWLLASETVSETESLRYRNIWRKVHDNEKINIVNIIIIYSTTDDFTTSFLHFLLFFAALRDLANSRPVHSLMLFESVKKVLLMHCRQPIYLYERFGDFYVRQMQRWSGYWVGDVLGVNEVRVR